MLEWYERITDEKPIPFREYRGHKAFLYYKWTTRYKNISLNLAWLRYNGALQTFKKERIIKFCEIPEDKELIHSIVRKGSKNVLLQEQTDEPQS